jgi:hypothetical protein
MKTARKISATTQKFIEIENIQDNIVLLTGGNACLVIEVIAANFELLSKEEQDSKISAYASLLNSLSFPIQIVSVNKKLDISSYLKLLEIEASKTQNKMLSEHIKLYKDFVTELVKINTILDKSFYIILSFSYLEAGPLGAKTTVDKKNGREEFLSLAKSNLSSKAETLHSQLTRVGLRAKTLGKAELTTLFYEIYNETTKQGEDLVNDSQRLIIKGGK